MMNATQKVIEEFANFSASLDNLVAYYYCHDLFFAFIYNFSVFLFSSLNNQPVTVS